VEVYTVLIKVYSGFFGKKWAALKTAGCWVAVKRTAIVINLDFHYKHEAVSQNISKSYNFGLLWQLESVLSSNNLNRQEAPMINVIEKWLFAFY